MFTSNRLVLIDSTSSPFLASDEFDSTALASVLLISYYSLVSLRKKFLNYNLTFRVDGGTMLWAFINRI